MILRDQIMELVSQFTDGDYSLVASEDGTELNVRCPFHKGGEEVHPSLYWNIDSGLFFCHSCKAGGGLPQFLRLVGMNRNEIEALVANVKFLSRRPRTTFQRLGRNNPLSTNMILPESILGLYDFEPNHLVSKGYDPAILDEYDIGYDLVSKRVTFPIRDVYGRLVGISGRADNKYQQPRYKIYKEEFHYLDRRYELKKRSILWNAHNAWAKFMHSPEQPVLILVEGFKAALYLIQLGYRDTVALMGSTISDVQRFILSMLGGVVIVFLDNDSAGLKGTRKIVHELRVRSTCIPYAVRYPGDASKYNNPKVDIRKAQPDSLKPETVKDLLEEILWQRK
jgi:5S rRNA maturation endonuclease (ribonuclease M5)